MIELTEKAVERLKEIGSDKRLRIVVMGGGCAGFQYQFSLDDSQKEDDLIFGEAGAEVIIDKTSLSLIDNSVLDFKSDLTGEMFVIKNPNAQQSCGCGNSFSL